MSSHRVYDASLPLYAAWSLESPIYTAVALLQIDGNETRALYSRSWKLKPLHECIGNVSETCKLRKMRVDLHIVPPDPDLVYELQFSDFGLAVEAAPKSHDTVTLTRRLFATLRIDEKVCPELVDALNRYAPREEPQGFVITAGHNLERFYVRTLELFAAWRHAGNGRPGDEWGPAPDYTIADRARI